MMVVVRLVYHRTFSTSPGGGVYKYTYSSWVKRGTLGEQVITSPRFSGAFRW
jgi:hypothetical protein